MIRFIPAWCVKCSIRDKSSGSTFFQGTPACTRAAGAEEGGGVGLFGRSTTRPSFRPSMRRARCVEESGACTCAVYQGSRRMHSQSMAPMDCFHLFLPPTLGVWLSGQTLAISIDQYMKNA